MKKREPVNIKIRKLQIVDYKGIDKLELNFPRLKMSGDPDVVVMGSRNGLGKTSVLECCALLLIGLFSREDEFELDSYGFLAINMPEMIIRAGALKARIEGELIVGDTAVWYIICRMEPGALNKIKACVRSRLLFDYFIK